MLLDGTALIVVSVMALGAFIGVIILAILLGGQISFGKALEAKNMELYNANVRLQSSVETLNAILKNWLQSEQQGLPVDRRQVQIASWLNQLDKLPTMSVNIGGSAVGGSETVGGDRIRAEGNVSKEG